MLKIVIPARFASTRLPGKPLRLIAGKPLLQWVYERASAACAAAAPGSEALIATDDERILAAARGFGATAIMTAADCASGTDRVAEVARLQGWDAQQIVVNAQGDEPLVPPQLLMQVARVLAEHARADMATLATPIGDLAELLDTNAVKVITNSEQRALYFSRAPIPWQRDGAPAGWSSQTRWQGARRHIGLYAYRVAALRRLAALPPSALEQIEQLEQLRALEAGFDIRVADCLVRPGPDVNTPADLERVAALLAG